MKTTNCRLCNETANPDALWVAKAKYWNVHVCWFQHTLGVEAVILKRHVENFTELTSEEITELGSLLKQAQATLNSKFNPDWFNIQMNGNWHHHLHFLLLPRYTKPRDFEGQMYVDSTFGQPIVYTHEEASEVLRKSLTTLLAFK